MRGLGSIVLVTAGVQVPVTFLASAGLALLLGFDGMESVIIGAALTFSSTVVAVKLLEQRRELHLTHGRLAVGVLLVQDVVVIITLTLLAALGGGGATGVTAAMGEIVRAFGAMILLSAVALLGARWLLARVDPDQSDYFTLKETIAQMERAGKPTAEAEAGLAHKISGPLSTLLMPLLAAVAAFGLARSGQVLLRATIGMALGFAYFVADNFSLAMGNAGAYPPLIAAWAPFFLFLLIGETVLVRTEE